MKNIIICILIGIVLFAWGTGTSRYVEWDENIQVASGSVVMEESASDPDFDVYVDSPVLYRQVEMYRYYEAVVKDKDNKKRVDWFCGWTSNPEAATPAGKLNPPWPEELYSKNFYGDVMLTESGHYLSDEVLDHFAKGFVYLENDYEMLPVSNLNEEAGKARGFSVEDNCFTTAGETPELGDFRITYWAVDPELLKGQYTVVGLVKDGVIGVHEDGYVEDTIYDRVIPAEEIKEDRGSFNGVFSVVTRILGAGLVLGPIGMLVLGKKKRKKKEAKRPV